MWPLLKPHYDKFVAPYVNKLLGAAPAKPAEEKPKEDKPEEKPAAETPEQKVGDAENIAATNPEQTD